MDSSSTINVISDRQETPALELVLKIPPKPALLGRFVTDLIEACYDVSVEQIYDDTFFEARINYYSLTISGSININQEDGEN